VVWHCSAEVLGRPTSRSAHLDKGLVVGGNFAAVCFPAVLRRLNIDTTRRRGFRKRFESEMVMRDGRKER
jgi:hypothetical protein